MLAKCTRLGLMMMTLFSLSLVWGQDCAPPTLQNGTFLHGNNVRALYAANGSQFWDGENSQFSITAEGANISTIFAQGLWIGGFDLAGQLKLSAATYGAANGGSDYYPGPLAGLNGSTDAGTCSNYDRAWGVYRYQILAHQADFADNGIIDNPLAEVVGWPGAGNPEFEAVNGFPLHEAPEGLAPFQDLDQDGIYEPLDGEYPLEPRHEIIPEHMVFTIFNTGGNLSTDSNSGSSITMEIHCLGWALNCSDNELLNNTIFTSYRFIDRDVERFEAVRIGLWNDFDLGCFFDDFVGSAPTLNTFFAYNADNNDEVECTGGIVGAGEDPPVQAVTLLNHSLDAFITSNNGAVGGPPPPTTDPQTVTEYYNFLSGRFRDGTPITEGGTGYNPDSDEVVSHIYPGDPNDPDTWSAFQQVLPTGDLRSVGSTLFESWESGEIIELDVAHSYYRAEDANFLGNVSEMYIGVAELQNLYDSNFASACTQPFTCEEDCIWSGDLNADGIANHEDVVALGFGIGASGAGRPSPYNWSPQDGDSWSDTQIFGTDTKHLDANGDGASTLADLDYTFYHYNFTRPDYEAVIEYPLGDELLFQRAGSNPTLTGLSPGESLFARVRLDVDVEDLRAIAFTLEYDPAFFQTFNHLGGSSTADDYITFNSDVPGLLDYSQYETDAASTIGIGNLFPMQVRIRNDFPPGNSSAETQVRFRNIRGWQSDGTEIDLGAASVDIQVDIVSATDEPAWAQSLSIFPNPVEDRLFLQTETSTIEEIQVLDTSGRQLIQVINTDNQIDLSLIPSGLYYARIFSQGEFVVRKFIKQ